jgi:hypothetical protein
MGPTYNAHGNRSLWTKKLMEKNCTSKPYSKVEKIKVANVINIKQNVAAAYLGGLK